MDLLGWSRMGLVERRRTVLLGRSRIAIIRRRWMIIIGRSRIFLELWSRMNYSRTK